MSHPQKTLPFHHGSSGENEVRPNSGFPVVIGDPSDHGGILEVCKPKRVVSQREMNYEVQKILVPIKTGCPPQCWRLLHEV